MVPRREVCHFLMSLGCPFRNYIKEDSTKFFLTYICQVMAMGQFQKNSKTLSVVTKLLTVTKEVKLVNLDAVYVMLLVCWTLKQ